ncbi:hypothetical protein SAMN05216241_11728 [Limimonas halophila]|uniref:Uncharacterized protein n=1 Tax=Limimonas halophila TaxID=1082479 RepID=A0A1G7UW24_9PROT|nr:hypothetical protein [Limimonas halophila]SDG51697.1 hypothetical protein SAMN05216241_11728 [Limimonas halophila]
MADRGRTYDPAFVEKLRRTLAEKAEEAPPRDAYTTREAVRQMRDEIRAMEQAGWRREQIVEVLREQGFHVTVNTLRTYLRDPGKAEDLAAGRGQQGQRRGQRAPANTSRSEAARRHSGFDEDV